MDVDVMNELMYDTLVRYFKTLAHTGYKSYDVVFKMLVIDFIYEITHTELRYYITNKDIKLMQDLLYQFLGSTCEISFPTNNRPCCVCICCNGGNSTPPPVITPTTTTSTPRPNKKMYIRNSSDNIGLEVSGGKIIDSSSSVILAGGNLEMSYIDKFTPLYIEGYGTSIDSISSIRIIDNKGGTIPVEETSSAGVFRTTSSLYSLIEENDITFIDIKVTKQVDTTTTTTSTLPAFKIIKVNNKTNIPIEILPGNHIGITTFIGTIPVDGVAGFDSILWGDTLGIIFGHKLDVGSELPKNFRIVAYTENGSYIEVPYNLNDQEDSHYPYLAIKIDIFPIIENTNIKSIYVYGTFLDYSTTSSTTSSTPTPSSTTTTSTSTRPPSIKVTNKSSLYLEFFGPVNDLNQTTGTPPIGPNSSVFLYKGNSSYNSCRVTGASEDIFTGRSGELTIKNAETLDPISTEYNDKDTIKAYYSFNYVELIEAGVKEIIIESDLEGATTTTSTSTTPPPTTTTTSTKYPNISLTNSTNQNFILTAPIVDGRDYQDLPVGGTAYIKQDDSVQTISLSDSMLDMKNADIIIRVYTAESSYEFYQFEKKESSIEIDFATLISNKDITRVVIEGTINFAPTTTTKPSNTVYYGVIKEYMDPNSFCSIPINELIDRSETKFKPIIGDSVNEFTIPQDGYFSYLIIPVDKVELQYAAFTSGGLTSTYYDSSKPNTPTALDPTPNGAYYSKYTRGGTAPYNKGGSYKGIDYDVYFAYINSGSIPEMINIRAKNK